MEAAITAATAGVDFAPVVAGVGAIGALLVVPLVAKKGIRIILSMFR